MSAELLILRPQPGASETAARARALGIAATVAPIFHILPLPWSPPDPDGFQAVMLTSANAARQAGPGLDAFLRLPCYAVGDSSAAAARQAGFTEVRAGGSDGAALAAMMAADGVSRAFHPCGREHLPVEGRSLDIERREVYAAEAVDTLPLAALEAIGRGAIVLLHSPRAARSFAALVEEAGLGRGRIALAAISKAAAEAAGTGWKEVATAAEPNDPALLELAGRLCKTGGGRYGDGE